MAAQKTPDIPEQFSWEKELERVAWFKEDLQKGGWNTVKRLPGATYYTRCFPDDPFSIKILLEWEIPLPANVAAKAFCNFEHRIKWDSSFHTKVLGISDDGAKLVFIPLKMPWPLWDRVFVVMYRMREFPEQNAWLVSLRDVKHAPIPEDSGVVRVINGGNFDYITPDERNPQEACKMLALSTNDYGGWLPKSSTWFYGRTVPAALDKTRQDLLKAIAEKQFERYR